MQSLNATAEYLRENGGSISQVVGIGITNQRETTVVWDKITGKPLHNAIVWLDNRTKGIVEELIKKSPMGKDVHRERSGLPISTYFSACKVFTILIPYTAI